VVTELGAALSVARRRLAPASDSPLLDAQTLLAHIMDRPRSWVQAHPEAGLSPDQDLQFETALRRLEAGEPLPYVLGRWEFFGLEFEIQPGVLIPRPETELLVERALDWLRAHSAARHFADVGAGSGCIAASLAVNINDLHGVATDISVAALQLARRNFERHGVAARVQPVCCDLLGALHGPFDLMCANLPYIPTGILKTLDVYRHEPALALDGGADGLDLIRRLLADAPRLLTRDGLLLAEIEAGEGQAALRLARSAFPRAEIALRQDLAGHDRLIEVYQHAD
jgi:release factor glutamine methyltransferase